MNEKYIPLYRKYRPQKLEEVVGQEHIKKALRNAIESARKGNYQAARFLINGEWKPTKNGRPTKREVEKEKRIQAGIDKAAEEADYLRIVK